MQRRFYLLIFLLAFFSVGARAEVPVKASVCEILNDPKAYDHKLVEVTGFASHGFEDSGFSDPECESRYAGLWMEYGGAKATGTMSTVSNLERMRPKPAVVEGMPVPLLEDDVFRRFDLLLHSRAGMGTLVHATVIARVFAEREVKTAERTEHRGYGHLGCCSLFMIQQVLSVDENRNPRLDTSDEARTPDWSSLTYLTPGGSYGTPLEVQRRADSGDPAYAFSDPFEVAKDLVLNYSKTENRGAIHLHELPDKSPLRHTYEGTVGNLKTVYRVVLTRPYWLSFYAAHPDQIAWTVIGAYSTDDPAVTEPGT